MAKRIKPKTLVITTPDEAVKAMEALARTRRDVDAIDIRMNKAIDTAKARAADSAVPLKAEAKGLANALATYAQLEKTKIFPDRKSIETPFGTYGFRKTTKLLGRAKITMAMVLEKLREYGFTEAIKTTETVNKEAMREWPDDRLAKVGMLRRSGDEFFIEVKTEELGQ